MTRGLIFIFLFVSVGSAFAQKDSLVFKNGQYIIGEVQKMDRGVVEIETSYSDSDFKVDWDKIKEIYVRNSFLVYLKDGESYIGKFEGKKDTITLHTLFYGDLKIGIDDIVNMSSYDEGFKDRFSLNIDVGFSLAKANNFSQFTTSSRAGYTARKWTLGGTISSILSNQDDQDETQNTEGSITFRYILHKGWFLFPEIVFLSNTQQNLDLRTSTKLGAGKYLLRTNKAYWTLTGGASRNIENFNAASETPNRQSWEAFFGTGINLYDIGDLNFILNANAYPSLTEQDRFRLDANFDIKYDLPLDFYIKLGTTYNFDNQPAEGGSRSNYTIQTGIGWEY